MAYHTYMRREGDSNGERGDEMAATMQVQRAQAAYKACGFKRGEFTAQVEQVYRGTRDGRALYEYGDLRSWVRLANEEKAQRAMGMIKHGYDVTILVYNGSPAHIGIKETRMPSGIGKVERQYVGDKDENGFDRIERVI